MRATTLACSASDKGRKKGLRRTALPILLALVFSGGNAARGEAALFLEEPFGVFGHMNPTGHAVVYLSRVCAASPVLLRRCEPGESGVVIGRYHRVGGYDWIAIPLIPYLYAVERPDEVPARADAALVGALRDSYRRRHLTAVVPEAADGKALPGDWTPLIGAAYDRKIYSLEIQTTPEQDDRLIEALNSKPNKSRFNLLFHNCADFSRSIINFYYPHASHRSLFSDAGITTPKQIAESLVNYSRRHPNLGLSIFAIAQVPGTLPRSKPNRGVLESFLMSKKYVLPVVILHPLITGGMAVAYLGAARHDPCRGFLRKVDCESRPAAILTDLRYSRAG